MGTHGVTWLATCAALAAVWVLALAWRSETGIAPTAVRGVLGGLAALGTAYILYGLMQVAGLDIRWEWIEKGAWPALGFAALIGLVEEVAKLAGIALAAPSLFQRGREQGVLRTGAAVSAVFAVAEALVTLRGASWPVALGRAALGPVAHGVLAAPFVVALAYAPGVSRGRLALRLAVAVGLAALLHGIGDWSVARPGWGRVGFAAALLAPALWLHAVARPLGRVPRQMGGRLFSPYPVSSTYPAPNGLRAASRTRTAPSQ